MSFSLSPGMPFSNWFGPDIGARGLQGGESRLGGAEQSLSPGWRGRGLAYARARQGNEPLFATFSRRRCRAALCLQRVLAESHVSSESGTLATAVPA